MVLGSGQSTVTTRFPLNTRKSPTANPAIQILASAILFWIVFALVVSQPLSVFGMKFAITIVAISYCVGIGTVTGFVILANAVLAPSVMSVLVAGTLIEGVNRLTYAALRTDFFGGHIHILAHRGVILLMLAGVFY